jgi:hypothetical protein
MKKILLIIPYFGNWPVWFDFFLHSCRYNPTVDWLLLSDNRMPENLPENIKFRQFSLSEYSRLVSERLNICFYPQNPYKLCDLKPMYGYVHEEELEGYDFWGFCDVDIIFGNLRSFLTNSVLANDVISCHSTRISGHFTILRNTPQLCNAFRAVRNWDDILRDPQNHQFDEKAFSKLFVRYKNYPEWVRPFIPGYNRLGVKIYFKERYSTPDCRIEWEDGTRMFPTEWYWNRGELTNNKSKSTFMYFHFLHWKQKFWKVDYKKENGHLNSGNAMAFKINSNCEWFKIDKDGFHS